jgi:hypothetical protein
MDADTSLMRAWSLGMGDTGWTDVVTEEAEELLPALVAAGFAVREVDRWHFTERGVHRAEEIEKRGGTS